jgi:hypothetical protein
MRSSFLLLLLILAIIFPMGARAQSQCLNIASYGGAGDGVTDNTAAFNAAIAAIGSASGCVSFGPGVFYFGSQLSHEISAGTSLTITGAGKGVTKLLWKNSGQGMVLTEPDATGSFNIVGLDFVIGVVNGGTALAISNVSSTSFGGNNSTVVRNVAFHGNTDSSYYWTNDLVANSVSLLNISDSDFSGNGPGGGYNGTGITVAGNGSTTYSIQQNISNCFFNNLFTGIYYGTFTQGMTVSNANFNTHFGILVLSGESNLDQLVVKGSQFQTADNAISIDSDVGAILLAENLFIVENSGKFAVNFAYGHAITITGNAFEALTNSGTAAISVTGASTYNQNANTVVGNHFDGFATAISLGSGSKGWNVQSNAYANNTTVFTNSGTGNVIGGGTP